ncbi:hypothetical protein HK102_011413, partial [Quaeritorhiza haematococci]
MSHSPKAADVESSSSKLETTEFPFPALAVLLAPEGPVAVVIQSAVNDAFNKALAQYNMVSDAVKGSIDNGYQNALGDR